VSHYFYQNAYSFDQMANVTGQDVFNVLLLKTYKNAFLFGDPDTTLSYTIATNWKIKNLNWFGIFWANFLIFVDFGARKRGSNHLLETLDKPETR